MTGLQGQFLIASPRLADPNFYRAVLLMVQHSDEGAMGLILNRPTEAHVRDVWSKVADGPCVADGPLFHGGPCEGPLMLLHTHEPASQIPVGHGIHFSADEEYVTWLMEHGGGPIRAFVGYAGWSPGQLESEIAAGSWLHTPADSQSALQRIPDWEMLLKELAPGFIEVKIVPEDPSVN